MDKKPWDGKNRVCDVIAIKMEVDYKTQCPMSKGCKIPLEKSPLILNLRTRKDRHGDNVLYIIHI